MRVFADWLRYYSNLGMGSSHQKLVKMWIFYIEWRDLNLEERCLTGTSVTQASIVGTLAIATRVPQLYTSTRTRLDLWSYRNRVTISAVGCDCQQ